MGAAGITEALRDARDNSVDSLLELDSFAHLCLWLCVSLTIIFISSLSLAAHKLRPSV